MQVFPHAPQSLPSDWRSTHALLQLVRPVPHDPAHVPALQTGEPPLHCVPQAPQSFGSVAVSTHAPLHEVSPAGHPQDPDAHDCDAPQTFPHAPQFRSLVLKLTHEPPQFVRPGSHVAPHTPRLHT